MGTSTLVRIPDHVLPTPGSRELPAPVGLRRMLGPSIILAGLSIGSGEFVLWPRLTAEWGYTLFWACWVGVTVQFFLNMEIARWSLLTGESAVIGFLRLWRPFAPIFLVCAVVPWVWPGWATGAATLISWQVGAPPLPTAVVGLVLCGAILSVGPVVYRTVESIQFVLVGVIFVSLAVLSAFVIRAEDVIALLRGAAQVGHVPEGVHFPMLLGAIAFAGAGGSVNLAQSNYILDKGYGMGKWIGRITSPLTGRPEAESDVGFTFEATDENLAHWRVWWRRTNVEHFISFYLLCVVSLALFCLLAGTLLESGQPVSEGFGFIRDEANALEERFGPWASVAFLTTGVIVLFSTELALLDAVSRVAADLLKLGFLRGRAIGLSQLYFVVLWSLIGFGVLVLVVGFDQPLLLLALSACLNGFVMFLYSGVLLWLNGRSFRGPLRPSPLRIAALLFSLVFFGYFSVLTVAEQLSGIG